MYERIKVLESDRVDSFTKDVNTHLAEGWQIISTDCGKFSFGTRGILDYYKAVVGLSK